jgi:maltooligosyltrehalose trehalohydrolase
VAFGWSPEQVPDPQTEETFLRSKLRWQERKQGVHAEMLDWYRRLIRLRREESALTCGDLAEVRVRFDEKQKWLWMTRSPIEVVFNAGTSEVKLPVAHRYRALLASVPGVVCEGDWLLLPAGSVAVLRDLDMLTIA